MTIGHLGRRGTAVVTLALLVLVPASGVPRAQTGGTIKIASQSPLSGGQALLGEGIKLGSQLAVERSKGNLEKMGYKVEFLSFDDQGKPDVGVANAKQIIADKDIMVVIGHLNSGVAIPASEVYREANLAMISPATTSPIVTDRNFPNVSRVSGRDDTQGIAGSRFASDTLKIKSAYLIHDKTPYGLSIATFFKSSAEAKGIKILGFDGTEERSTFDPLIASIGAKNPDLIYFAGTYDQAAPFFKRAREKGVKAKFMGPDGMDSSDLTKVAGKAVVDMIYTSTATAGQELPTAKAFVDDFKKRFNKNPEPYAAEAFDATIIAFRAIEDVAKSGKPVRREDVAAAVRKVKLTGITGDIAFDSKGDRLQVRYFVRMVTSDDPAKWGDNKVTRIIIIAQACAAGTCQCTDGSCAKACC